jgi:tetratricopeptide (TPR) repeat protein
MMRDMDPVPQTFEQNLRRAEEQEQEYEWDSAATYYQRALRGKSKEGSRPEVWERLGNCYDRASRQAHEIESFKDLKKQAVNAYQNAARLFSENGLKPARSASYSATAALHNSWLASTISEKKACYDECYTSSEKA